MAVATWQAVSAVASAMIAAGSLGAAAARRLRTVREARQQEEDEMAALRTAVFGAARHQHVPAIPGLLERLDRVERELQKLREDVQSLRRQISGRAP